MKISDPYFSNVPGIGDLNFDYCIVEYEVPILFICKDKQGKYYLCDCCEIRSKQEWLIVPVVIEDVLALFEKKITLKNFFKDRESLGYFGTYKIGWTKEKIKKVESFDEQVLPADEYLYFNWDIVKLFRELDCDVAIWILYGDAILDIDSYTVEVPGHILFTMTWHGIKIKKLEGVGKNDA